MQLTTPRTQKRYITLAQVFFEKKFVANKVGKIPLNLFELNPQDSCYYPTNMEKEEEVKITSSQFYSMLEHGVIDQEYD
jgi:hypothetical protein